MYDIPFQFEPPRLKYPKLRNYERCVFSCLSSETVISEQRQVPFRSRWFWGSWHMCVNLSNRRWDWGNISIIPCYMSLKHFKTQGTGWLVSGTYIWSFACQFTVTAFMLFTFFIPSCFIFSHSISFYHSGVHNIITDPGLDHMTGATLRRCRV